AKVGDSQRGEDPSVLALEEHAASLFGKEAGFFVPSGTMGNLVSVASWTRPGDIVVASSSSHIAGREAPGISNLAAVALLGIDAPGGIFTAEDVAGAIASTPSLGRAKVRLVAAENTHNAGGGTIFPIASLRRIHALCRKADIPVHIDGSRIFNASVASGVPPAEYGKTCHSLMFCLSKGLGAPVGSVVVGSRDFVEEARSVGLRIGGGMRQAGIVAAGGLYALRNNVKRLAEDHENAKELARALAELPGIELINSPVKTNIIQFRWNMPTLSLPRFQEALGGKGVLVDDRAFPVFRAVTHLGIGKKEVARVVRALRQVFG
ncbi:MAG TPA: GntG family PLP-dependent aldolase, partial [Candidatus Limnocylindria bacterium]|nr:GntG family PLP-dependent aldolase [Candidatus Limnocylindria bacterium]